MNKNNLAHTIVSGCLLCCFFSTTAFTATGFFGDGTGGAIFYTTDGSTAGEGTYLNVGSLNGTSFGEYVVGSTSLLLRGGEAKTFKNNGGDVYGVNQYYRIYLSGETPGSFNSFGLPFSADLGGGDQRWKKTDQNVNLATGLTTSGTYEVQFYWEQYGNQGNQYLSNNGTNYTTSFSLYYDITAGAGTTNTQSASGGNGVFAGDGKFVKRGDGTTEITNANSGYSGKVYVDAGTLNLAAGAGLGSTNVYIGPDQSSGNATLNIGDANGGTTLANNVIIRSGGGTRTAGGTNSSGVNEFSGNLYLDGDATLSAASGGTVTFSSAILQGSLMNEVDVAISGGGTVEFSGGETNSGITLYTVGNGATLKLNKSGADAVQSTLLIENGGTVEMAASDQLGTSAVINNSGTLAIGEFSDSFGTLNSSGDITGTGTLTAGTYNLSGGTVGANLGGGTLNVTNDTTLNGESSATTVAITGNTQFTLGATADRLAANAVVTLAASSSISFGASQTLAKLSEVGTTNGGTASIANGGTLTISGDDYEAFQNSISGEGALTKSGSGTLALYGTQGYTGKTTVSEGLLKTQNDIVSFASTNIEVAGGTFQTQSAGILSGSAVVTVSGGTFSLGGNDTVGTFEISSGTLGGEGTLTASTYALNGGTINAVLGAGAVTVATGTTELGSAGRLNSASTLTVNSGQLTLGGGETVASLAGSGGTIALGNGSLTLGGNSYSNSYAGVISGNGSLIKNGTGTLTLSGENSYTGGTMLNGGTLDADSSSAFGTGSVTVGSGTILDLLSHDVSNLIVNNGGTVLSAGVLSDVDAEAGETTIGGNGSTVTQAAGTATVTVTASDVIISNVAGSAQVNIAGTGAAVETVSGGTVTLSNGATGASVNAASAGTVNANAAGVRVGTISSAAVVNVGGADGRVATLAGGTLNANAAGLVITNKTGGNLAVSNGVTVGLRSGNSSGVISGAGGIAKQGVTTLTLSGANTYSGATTVEEGKLVVNGSITNSTVTVQSGAKLGGSGAVGSTTLLSGASINPGNSPGTITNIGDLTWSGGASYDWEIFNVSGTPGSDWDLIDVTGDLLFSSISSTNRFSINIFSLSALPSTVGPLAGWNSSTNYSWTILTAGSNISGFDANNFNLNLANFTNNNSLDGGSFSLAVNGGDLNLLFEAGSGPAPAAVPEPGTWAAAALLAGAAGYVRWRRRKGATGPQA